MSATITLLHLAGYVALLLWGVHMVQTGVMRAFGGSLRKFITGRLGGRLSAFAAGVGVTALMQSSTATGMLTSGFVSGGVIGLVPALAVMLGANVGTTLIVQVMTFPVAALAPLFFLAGVIAFKRSGRTRGRDLGRAGIGLGLIMLALHLIVETVRPVEQADAMREIFAVLTGEPVLNVLIAALLTWAMYSSVAVLLLVMSLAATQIVTPEAALALVLGANLGNVIPQWLAAGSDAPARRLAFGNIIVRAVGCLAVLPFLPMIGHAIAALEPSPARLTADFHTLFNLASALVFIGLLDPLARLCTKLFPASRDAADPGRPRYLGGNTTRVASVRLATAEREVLRMVDMVENMLRIFLDALHHDDRKLLAEIERMDNIVDSLHRAIKLFLIEISRQNHLDETDARRCADILAFTINLEHAGDILDKSLREIAAKKIKYKLNFSQEGFGEILEMHECLLEDLRLAMSVFMTGDERAARTLLDAKVRIRELERAATDNHIRRLREGRVESMETSALHLDIVRDLKRIAAHIASVANPVLERNGLLLRSRVATDEYEALAGRNTG
jgi:phosphate:Na+ symporter